MDKTFLMKHVMTSQREEKTIWIFRSVYCLIFSHVLLLWLRLQHTNKDGSVASASLMNALQESVYLDAEENNLPFLQELKQMILHDFAVFVLGHVDHGGRRVLAHKRIGGLHLLNAEFSDHGRFRHFDVIRPIALVDVGDGTDVLRPLTIKLGGTFF